MFHEIDTSNLLVHTTTNRVWLFTPLYEVYLIYSILLVLGVQYSDSAFL